MSIVINKGFYGTFNSIEFHSDTEISLAFGSKYVITGTNGTGKTTLCDNILYPAVKAICENRNPYLYISQDVISLHYLTKTYYKYFHQADIASFDDSLRHLIRNHLNLRKLDQEIVFIMDEPDLHLGLPELKDIASIPELTLFFISHNIDRSLFHFNINLTKQDSTSKITIE